MSRWNLCSEMMPRFKDEKSEYSKREMLITIPQGDKLKVVAAHWVKTTVKGKRVERWEWRDRICPWEPIHWSELPSPPPMY